MLAFTQAVLSARTIIAQRRRVIASSLLVSLLSLSVGSFIRVHNTGTKTNPDGFNGILGIGDRTNDPQLLLAAADRFYWLNNGAKAAPLYAKAEQLFAAKGDVRDEIHAKVGRLRSEAERMSFVELSQLLDDQLHRQIVRGDARLHLWCLAAKGYTDIEINYRAAKSDWLEAQNIAQSLGETQWATRARGELGLVAFLEGNPIRAARLLGRALLSAMANGDIGGQVRFLELIGGGFEPRAAHQCRASADRGSVPETSPFAEPCAGSIAKPEDSNSA